MTDLKGLISGSRTRHRARGRFGAHSRLGCAGALRLAAIGCGAALLLAVSGTPAGADSTGELQASVSHTASGGFTNAANAFACNGSTATVTANNQVHVYGGFGISLPPTAIVTGIQVRVRANDGTRNNRRFRVSLSWNGGSTYTSELQTSNFRRNTPLRDYIVGGSAVTWNRTWTESEFSDANFRVRLLGRKPGQPGDDINLDCLPVTVFYRIPGAPNLNLAKVDSPDPVEPEQQLTYTITYSNTGESTATNLIVADTVPADTTFVSASPPPASAPAVGGSGTVTWNIASVPPGGSGSVTLVVKVDAGLSSGDQIVNSSYSVASDQNSPSPGNPVTTTVVNPVILSLSKIDSPDPVKPGANLVYVLTYTNAGGTPATGVTVGETYDPNVTFVSSVPAPDPTFTDQWTLGTLAPGASGTITITVAVKPGLADGVLLTNFADIFDDADGFAEAGAVTTVQNVASLSISKSDSPDPVASGGVLTYTIQYENTGTTTLTGVTILESYDANVAFDSAVPPPDMGTDTWTIGSLDPGDGGTITITTEVAPGLTPGTLLHNQIFISDDQAHSASAATSTLVVAPPCGDGIVQMGEQCDEGAANGTSASCCSSTCTFRAALEPCDDDGNVCTDDVCSGANAACQHVANTAPCDDGVFCNGADTCAAGSCSVHAGDPCPGPNGDLNCAESCDEGSQSCTGLDPAGTSCRPSAGECDVAEVCDGMNPTCPPDDFEPAGTDCGSPLASDCTAPDTCNGAGACQTNDTLAGTPCTDDGLTCTVDACDGAGTCGHQPGNAGTVCRAAAGDCDAAEECDGVSAACPPDDFEPAGSSCGSPDDTDCTDPDTCDGAGACLANDAPSGASCGSSDDTECTAPDSCDGSGTCLANDASAGSPCPDDGLVCTVDACDGAGVCDHQPGNSGTECRAATGACDAAEVCDGMNAACPGDAYQPAGTSCGSPANTDCTNPDTCDGNNQCLPNHEPAGTPCGAAVDSCTVGATCNGGGSCTGGGDPVVCPICERCDLSSGCVPVSQLSCFGTVPDRNAIAVVDRPTNRNDRIVFRQKLQDATVKSDFGNPQTGPGYEVCIYDDKPAPLGLDTLAYAIDVPGGSTWRETARGFVNRSSATDPALITVLRAGNAGKGLVRFRAKGAALGLAPHSATEFFSQSGAVKVILAAKGSNRCFRTQFTPPARRNLPAGFRDKE